MIQATEHQSQQRNNAERNETDGMAGVAVVRPLMLKIGADG